MKDSASSYGTPYSHRRTALFHDLKAEPKPKTISSAPLGCVESLEDSTHNFGVHSNARISNGQAHAKFTGVMVHKLSGAKDQAATVWHCVQGIAYQISDDLAQLTLGC